MKGPFSPSRPLPRSVGLDVGPLVGFQEILSSLQSAKAASLPKMYPSPLAHTSDQRRPLVFDPARIPTGSPSSSEILASVRRPSISHRRHIRATHKDTTGKGTQASVRGMTRENYFPISFGPNSRKVHCLRHNSSTECPCTVSAASDKLLPQH